MADTTTLNETTKTPLDGNESIRLATAGANWRKTLRAMCADGNIAPDGLNINAVINTTASYNWNSTEIAIYAVTPSVGNLNWFIGNSGNPTVTGATNMGMGEAALAALTTGNGNVGIGPQALTVCAGGKQNMAVGTQTLLRLVTGQNNCCVGFQTATFLDGANYNTYIGTGSGPCTAASAGSANIGIGQQAVSSITSGGDNVGIGASNLQYGALQSLTTGSKNTAVGSDCLGSALTTGSQNTCVGYLAGKNLATSDSYNVVIGSHAGTAGTNNTLIVADGQANVWMQGGSSQQVYFPGITTTASAANAFIDNASSPVNSLLRSTSSLRYKDRVSEIPNDRIAAAAMLRPIEFSSLASADDKNARFIGYAAEDVHRIDPGLVSLDAAGRPDGVMYDRLLLLQIEALKQELKELREKLNV